MTAVLEAATALEEIDPEVVVLEGAENHEVVALALVGEDPEADLVRARCTRQPVLSAVRSAKCHLSQQKEGLSFAKTVTLKEKLLVNKHQLFTHYFLFLFFPIFFLLYLFTFFL